MLISDVEPGFNTEQDQISVHIELTRIIDETLVPWGAKLDDLGVGRTAILSRSLDLATDDLLTMTRRDPASRGSLQYVLEAYSCYRAVLAYRLAHTVLTTPGVDPLRSLILARSISEAARVRTGVEIHPAATIGPRFVVDHGMGTVIGEDVTLGADCYVLQGVVLGAMGIGNNPSGRRHPQLGDRVQVGGFARILGPITIGDDVVIGSHALVRTDVPAGSQVAVLHQYQLVTGQRPITVFGVEVLGQFRFRLHGAELDRPGLKVDLLTPAQLPLAAGEMTILQRNAKCMTVQVSPRAQSVRSVTHIRVRQGGSEVTVSIPVGRRARVRAQPRPG
jgi:serine O-acetyltransferase